MSSPQCDSPGYGRQTANVKYHLRNGGTEMQEPDGAPSGAMDGKNMKFTTVGIAVQFGSLLLARVPLNVQGAGKGLPGLPAEVVHLWLRCALPASLHGEAICRLAKFCIQLLM